MTVIKVSTYKKNEKLYNSNVVISQKTLKWNRYNSIVSCKFELIIQKLIANGFRIIKKIDDNFFSLECGNTEITIYLAKA